MIDETASEAVVRASERAPDSGEYYRERRVEPLKLRFARSIKLKSMSGEWKREREERGEVPEDPVKTTLANTIVHCVRKRHFMFLFRPPSTKAR